MPEYYENTGGLSSLPRRTVLGGEEHLLSYITPEEAQMLREEGGGVTPTGGQYRGPGGLPAFWAPGNPGVAGGGTGAPGSSSSAGGPGTGIFGGIAGNPASAAQAAAAAAAQGDTVGSHGGISSNPLGLAPDFSYGMDADAVAVAQNPADTSPDVTSQFTKKAAEDFSKQVFDAVKGKAFDPNRDRTTEVQDAMDRSKISKTAQALGFVPGLASQANMAKAGTPDAGFFSPYGYTLGNKTLSPADIMSMPTSMFTGNTPFGIAGDPESLMGKVVPTVAKGLFGLIAPPMLNPTLTGLMNLANIAETFGDVTGMYDMNLPWSHPVFAEMELFSDIVDYAGDEVGDLLGDLDISDQLGDLIGEETAQDIDQAISDVSKLGEDVYGFFASDIPEAVEAAAEDAYSDSVAQAIHDSLFSGKDAPFSSTGHVAQFGKELGEIPGEVGEAIGEGLSSVADAIGLSEAAGFVGETADTVGEAIGDALSLPNIDISLGDLGDIFSGTPSLATVGPQGGGPGISQFQPSAPRILTPAQEKASTFKTYPPKPPRQQQDFTTAEDIFSRYIGSPEDIKEYPEGYSLADIQNRYISSPTIYAHSGGGIQNLVADQEKNYSIGNQDTIDTTGTAFSRKPFSATPHADLTNGSHSYISNVLNGHAFPQGMTNVQQMQKPMEAFPSGGQMNYNNTLHADYSRPQSFYAMPNMNKVG